MQPLNPDRGRRYHQSDDQRESQSQTDPDTQVREFHVVTLSKLLYR
jgi:hypothetical protein